jgi:cell division septation protein DedD
MKNNETGEFELVMGNRQLLSGFFVVVVLFAVFFVMGYIVGRNSTPPAPAASNRDQTSGPAPSGARPQPASGTAPALQNPPSAAAEPPKEDGGSARASEPTTQPAQQTDTRHAAPVPAAPSPVEAASGETYLQVTAVKQDVAETVAKTLKDKGFPAVLSPGPAGKTRVLVGPYADLAKLGEAKAELERLGFSPFVKR